MKIISFRKKHDEQNTYYKNISTPFLKIRLKYLKLNSVKKKYFLLCEDCFWMASTLRHPSYYSLIRYKICPICKNNVDTYPIPDLF